MKANNKALENMVEFINSKVIDEVEIDSYCPGRVRLYCLREVKSGRKWFSRMPRAQFVAYLSGMVDVLQDIR